MIAAIIARLEASCPALTSVELAEDLELIANGPAPEHGSAYVVPLRERAEPNPLMTGGHRQRVRVQIATGFVISSHEDIRGAARAAQFEGFKTAIEAALAGWHPDDDALDPLSLVAGEGTALGNGVSIYVQTWETARFLTGA